MDEFLIGLAKDSPLVAIIAYLLYRLFRREDATLDAYKSGASTARAQAESQSSLAASIESMERSLGSLQTTVHTSKLSVDEMLTRVIELHADVRSNGK